MSTAAVRPVWYVVRTKPRQEQLAAENLLRQGYSVYLPRIRLYKCLRGRQQICSKPLFPSYLFVRPSSNEHLTAPVRSTLGVCDLVCFRNRPVLMLDEVETLLDDGDEDIDRHGDPYLGFSGNSYGEMR